MKPGDVLGPYRLIGALGRGGFAEVWRARLEPGRAKELPPQDLLPALRVLAQVLAAPSPARSTLIGNLLENTQLLSTTQESAGVGAPESVSAAQRALVSEVLGWLESDAPLATGELDVALKVPFHDGYVRQLRREKDVLKRVQHANLVRQYALNATHDPPYLVMERVDGWSLRDALKTEPLPPMKKILAVMDQLLTALGYLHRRGLAHGDVKPENVVMQPDGTLRLIDLGLGQVSQAVMRDVYLSLSLASRVPLLGTLAYMAPEVRSGETPGPEADLYSAGIVLYEMLVGDVPTGMALPTEAATERQLTERFDVLLKWVLHPDPGRRIATAEEFRERVLVALNPRARHPLGTGEKRGKPRPGTLEFDQWALEAASPFVQGDWLGEFQLGEPVGRGGFGEVWRAHPGPESAVMGEVALKIAIGPKGRDALVKEADIAGRLDHPTIPKVRSSHLDHDPPFLVVEFVSGVSLRQALNEQGKLEPSDAVIVGASLAQSLMHCHAMGVLHQDVKPENLLLDDDGCVHLLDFGLATVGDDVPAEGLELSKHLQSKDAEGGTYEYMAPERKQGGASTTAADVYSAGVVLFELLTGQLPRGLTRLRELAPAAPGALETLCTRMLAPEPNLRPGLEAVWDQLEAVKPKRATFGAGRRRERLVLRGPSLAPLAAASCLPLLVAAVGLAGGWHAVAAGGFFLAVLATGWFLRRAAARWRTEELVLWGALPLASLVGGVVTLLPAPVPTVWQPLQDLEEAAARAVDRVDFSEDVASLRARADECASLDREIATAIGEMPVTFRAEAVALRQSLGRRRLRLEAWARSRNDAGGLAEEALTERATLLVQTREPEHLPEDDPVGWAEEQAKRQETFARVREKLAEAEGLDPLSPKLSGWREIRRRLVDEERAWREATRDAGLAAVRSMPPGRARLQLLLGLETLFPGEHLLGPELSRTPVPYPEVYGQRAALAVRLARSGRMKAAQAVADRLPHERPEAKAADAELRRVAADRAAAREGWHAASELGASERLDALQAAARVLSDERALREALVRARAQASVAADDSVPARETARLQLWTELTPSTSLIAWADQTLAESPLPGVARLAAPILALDGRVAEARALVASLQEPERARLTEALDDYALRRAASGAALAALEETEARLKGVSGAQAQLRKAFRELMSARREEERSANQLRFAGEPR